MIIFKNQNNLEIESISGEIFISKINIDNLDKNKIERIKNYIKNKIERRELLKNINDLRRINCQILIILHMKILEKYIIYT